MSARVDQIASQLSAPRFIQWLREARDTLSAPPDTERFTNEFEIDTLVLQKELSEQSDELPLAFSRRFEDFMERESLYGKCLVKAKTILLAPFDVVLPTELADELVTCYLALPPASAKEAIEVTVARLRRLVGEHRRQRRSCEVSVLRNETVPQLMPKWRPAEQKLLLAKDEDLAIQIQYSGIVNTFVKAFGSTSYGAELHVVVDGTATDASWSHIERELRLTLPCIFECLIGVKVILRNSGNALGGWRLGRREVKALAEYDGPFRFFVDSQPMIRQCVELILSPRLIDKKDDLLWRLRRCIVMLSHAREQENASVSLALSFAAMEALFSFDKDLVADKLAANLVAFLVPEGSERLEFKRLIKKAYDRRSQYVHGSNDQSASDQMATDMLAFVGATLRAVLEWRAFRNRMSDTATVNDLKESCEQSSATAQQVVGAPDWYWMFIPRSLS